jgi:hypothetical protein
MASKRSIKSCSPLLDLHLVTKSIDNVNKWYYSFAQQTALKA